MTTINGPTSCLCNNFIKTPSGGISFDGIASVSDTIIKGGIEYNGTVSVDTNHPFDGMSGVWFLDEDGSGVANEFIDSAPNERHGSSNSIISTPIQVDGLNCSYGNFFHEDDFIGMEQDKILSTQAFTVSMWVRLEEIYSQRVFFSRGFTTTENDWVFVLGHSYIGNVFARLQKADETIHYCFSSAAMEKERWYHIACVYDPETGLKNYINGTLDGTNTEAIGENATLNNGSSISRFNNGGFFHGTLQDIRLHPVKRDANWLTMEKENYCGSLYSIGDTNEPVLS